MTIKMNQSLSLSFKNISTHLLNRNHLIKHFFFSTILNRCSLLFQNRITISLHAQQISLQQSFSNSRGLQGTQKWESAKEEHGPTLYLTLVSFTRFTKFMCYGWLSDLETRAAAYFWSWPVSLHQWNQRLHNICHQRSVICLWLHTHCSNCCYLNNLFHWVLTLQSRIHNLYNLISICQPRQSLCKRKKKGMKGQSSKKTFILCYEASFYWIN